MSVWGYQPFVGTVDSWYSESQSWQMTSRPSCHSLSATPERKCACAHMYRAGIILREPLPHHFALHQLFDGTDQFSGTGRLRTTGTSGETGRRLEKRGRKQKKARKLLAQYNSVVLHAFRHDTSSQAVALHVIGLIVVEFGPRNLPPMVCVWSP